MLQFNEFYEIRFMEDTKVALQQLGITNQKPNWKEIFGFDKDAKLTFNDVYKKYRKLMLQYHPDRTGNNDVTILLNDLLLQLF